MADPKPGNISLNQPLNGAGDGIRAVGDCANNLLCYETTETVTTESGETTTVKSHRGCIKMFFDSPAFPAFVIGIGIGLFARGRIGSV